MHSCAKCNHYPNTQELNRKSQMVEEAVEEVLELVRKAAEAFKAAHESDDFDFLVDGNILDFGKPFCHLLI